MSATSNSNQNKVNKGESPWINWISNNSLFHFISLIVLPFAVYYSTISFGYSGLDDTLIIKDHINTLRNIHNIKFLFCTDAFLHNPGGMFYRPVQSLSFMIDTIIGRGWIGMYHLSSLLIHIGTVISLYILLNLLSLKRSLSYLFSLLFAVHPLLTSNISWIPARGDLLIGLIGLWIFITYHLYAKTNNVKYIIIHGILFMLGLFTKETIILFPVLLLFYSWVILSSKKNSKSTLLYCSMWSAMSVVYYFMHHKAIHAKETTNEVLGIKPFINNIIEIPIIIGKIFIPQDLTTLPLYNNLALSIGLLFSILMLFIVVKSWKEKNWLIFFGLLWFVLFSFPPLIVKVKYADYFFNYLEHRTYLPIIGFIISISFFIARYSEKIRPIYTLISAVVLLIIFSILTNSHAQNYKDTVSFYSAAINSNPTKNAFAYNNRAQAFFELKDNGESIVDHESAVKIFPNAGLFYNKGYTEMKIKDIPTAMSDFSKAISLDSTLANAFIYRSTIYDGLKQYAEAMKDIEKAEKISKDKALVYCKKGNIFLHQNKIEDAIQLYTKSIQLNKRLIEPFNKRAQAYFLNKEYNKAIEDCKSALAFNIENNDVYNNMGMIYLQMGDYDKSIESFSNILKGNNNDQNAYFARAIVEQKAGNISNACADWKTALQLGIKPAQDSLNKYCK